MIETRKIPFYNDTLLGVKDENGIVWLAVKKTCLDIGLSEGQARRQVLNVQEEEPLKSNCHKFVIVQSEGNKMVEREQLFLQERVVTLWLAKISLTPNMKKKSPELFDKLVKYQLQAAEVLHNYFMGTDEKKKKFYTELNIKGDISDLKFRFDAVNCSINHHSEIMERIEKLALQIIDTSTINTQQQQKLYKIAKDRINLLLGGAHSEKYRVYAKSYFINLWNDFKKYFFCGSYKDLNPFYFEKAKNFINEWVYGTNK